MENTDDRGFFQNDFKNAFHPFFAAKPVSPEAKEGVTRLTQNWGWILAAGIVIAILGIFALRVPVAATVGVTYALGAILMATGVVQWVEAFQLHRFMKIGGLVFQGVISFLAGFLILRYPAAGMIGATLAIVFYLFVSAVGRWMLSAEMRPQSGWGWLFINSVISFLLGVFLISTLPTSALFVPGIFLGIDLIISGISLIAVSMSMRRVNKAVGAISPEEEARKAA